VCSDHVLGESSCYASMWSFIWGLSHVAMADTVPGPRAGRSHDWLIWASTHRFPWACSVLGAGGRILAGNGNPARPTLRRASFGGAPLPRWLLLATMALAHTKNSKTPAMPPRVRVSSASEDRRRGVSGSLSSTNLAMGHHSPRRILSPSPPPVWIPLLGSPSSPISVAHIGFGGEILACHIRILRCGRRRPGHAPRRALGVCVRGR
jgi:hypothetical protein